MPTRSDHAATVAHNLRLLGTVTPAFCPAWCSVLSFYTAVHLVEQLAAVSNQHFTHHKKRLKFLESDHPVILDAFAQMGQVGHAARYDTHRCFLHDYEHVVEPDVVGKWLPEIQKYVEEWFAANTPPSE